MLRIITGRAGCGKSAAVFRRMREEGACRPQLLLVPEQASFENEQRFCRENGNQAGMYGEVLSFARLENRVITLARGRGEPVLDQGGRLLMMYAAVQAVSSRLTVYAMPTQKPEFLGSLLTTLDELKSGCVTAAQLSQVGEETEGLDGDKLRDLGLIFGAYEAMTARSGLDPRDKLTRLAEKLRGFPFFRGKDVYLDGFTDFTPQQRLVLEQMMKQAHSVTVALTWDGGEDEETVFAPAGRTIAKLKRLAAQVGSPVEETHLPAREGGRTPPLDHLEGHLFARPLVPYEGAWDGSVVIHGAATPQEEVQWTAGEIRRLVQCGRVRYRDIAVSARSMDRYWEQIQGIFPQYQIPVFQSEKTDILQKPIFTLITAAMDAVNGGYLYEDMFRYLKTGLTGLTPDQCDRLENYVLTWDIWGSRWTSAKGWTMHPGGYHQTFTPRDQEELDDLNQLRLQVMAPLETLRKKAKGTVGEQVLVLYGFLEEIHAPEALEARADRLLEQGEPELAREYSQLWDIFCGALEQCMALLGEMEADFASFTRLLRLLLSQYTVGSIPASLDRVTAGDAQRLGGRSCRVLFLLGADDGSIPQVTPGQGLLTDRDRELLEEYGMELSPRMEEKLGRENTILYTICAQPREKLVVTWPRGGESGGEKRPSFLVETLRQLFPQGEEETPGLLPPDQLRAMAHGMEKVRAALEDDPVCAPCFAALDRAAAWERGKLSPQAVARLYGEKVAMSASRMDQYQSCHFAYFLRYGLGAKDRRPAGFHAPEYGTFVHFVLERVFRSVGEEGGIQAVSQERLRDLTQEAVEDYVLRELGGMEHQTPRFRYLFRRLQRNVWSVVENVAEELRASDFQPVYFELGFGSGKELPPVEVTEAGVTLKISGFVDRVDGWVKDGRLYLRVVDYKTGRKSFDLTEVWNGLGLQMLLYLFTLEDKGERLFHQKPCPAGVLYLPARDAMVAGSRAMDESARQKLMDKELVRKGLILEEGEVPEAMEHPENGLRFLPLRVSSRTGKITGDALVSAQKLGRLKRHTQEILGQICRAISAGNLDADPYWRGPTKNACLYCEYFRACQFEEGRDKRRWIPSVKNSDFWAWLAQREEGGEDHGGAENP
ncbi:MAG: PD-(D/E)XK nuclease family protein [Evtepia sp.]|uniref:PD-(D/E)XK nuclease family protein n=1 Tax=Evtepia sp. TaxID=2773933 RepID=UPI002A765B34|nr:PD-(D/E)XK nuclease family protein [Evtepia sp.]MDY3015147.1 PD-(D/E)XK nuclease family protein [Evtepia sp.]